MADDLALDSSSLYTAASLDPATEDTAEVQEWKTDGDCWDDPQRRIRQCTTSVVPVPVSSCFCTLAPCAVWDKWDPDPSVKMRCLGEYSMIHYYTRSRYSILQLSIRYFARTASFITPLIAHC